VGRKWIRLVASLKRNNCFILSKAAQDDAAIILQVDQN
jgi:hypothetical protein